MSAPTDPALLAQYTSDAISYAQYQAIMEERSAAIKDQDAIRQLQTFAASSAAQGQTACNDPATSAQLVQSELALLAESTRRRQERATREAIEQQQREADAQAVKQAYAVLDMARSQGAISYQESQAVTQAIAQTQQQIGQAKTERQHVEDFRRQVEEQPFDWASLPAEEQGFAIAEELAARRAFLAETFGDELETTEPAYKVQPIVDEQGRYTAPNYIEDYKPGGVESLLDITIPETDIYYPDPGGYYPIDWPGWGGESAYEGGDGDDDVNGDDYVNGNGYVNGTYDYGQGDGETDYSTWIDPEIEDFLKDFLGEEEALETTEEERTGIPSWLILAGIGAVVLFFVMK